MTRIASELGRMAAHAEKRAFMGALLRKLLSRMRAGSAMKTQHLGRYNTAPMLKRHRRAIFNEKLRRATNPTTTEQSLDQAAKQLDPGFPKGRQLQDMIDDSEVMMVDTKDIVNIGQQHSPWGEALKTLEGLPPRAPRKDLAREVDALNRIFKLGDL